MIKSRTSTRKLLPLGSARAHTKGSPFGSAYESDMLTRHYA